MVDRSMKVVAEGVEVAEHAGTVVAALEPVAKRRWVAEPALAGVKRSGGGGGVAWCRRRRPPPPFSASSRPAMTSSGALALCPSPTRFTCSTPCSLL
jgi:hypothetical protein